VRNKIFLVAGVVLLGLAAACTGSGRVSKPMAAAGGSSALVARAGARYAEPSPASFTLTVQIRTRSCSDAAPCDITYQLAVAYAEVLPLDPAVTYEVSYRVWGLQDPVLQTFTVTGNVASVWASESASAMDPDVVTATATMVDEL
jgi:hypothetical protein